MLVSTLPIQVFDTPLFFRDKRRASVLFRPQQGHPFETALEELSIYVYQAESLADAVWLQENLYTDSCKTESIQGSDISRSLTSCNEPNPSEILGLELAGTPRGELFITWVDGVFLVAVESFARDDVFNDVDRVDWAKMKEAATTAFQAVITAITDG